MSDTVKLIIEIPKETKQAFDKAESNDLKGGYYDLGGVIGKAIQNGIPLDDVKAEIEEKISHYEHFQSSNTAHGLNMALEIIDKHLADMRGNT